MSLTSLKTFKIKKLYFKYVIDVDVHRFFSQHHHRRLTQSPSSICPCRRRRFLCRSVRLTSAPGNLYTTTSSLGESAPTILLSFQLFSHPISLSAYHVGVWGVLDWQVDAFPRHSLSWITSLLDFNQHPCPGLCTKSNATFLRSPLHGNCSNNAILIEILAEPIAPLFHTHWLVATTTNAQADYKLGQ